MQTKQSVWNAPTTETSGGTRTLMAMICVACMRMVRTACDRPRDPPTNSIVSSTHRDHCSIKVCAGRFHFDAPWHPCPQVYFCRALWGDLGYIGIIGHALLQQDAPDVGRTTVHGSPHVFRSITINIGVRQNQWACRDQLAIRAPLVCHMRE